MSANLLKSNKKVKTFFYCPPFKCVKKFNRILHLQSCRARSCSSIQVQLSAYLLAFGRSRRRKIHTYFVSFPFHIKKAKMKKIYRIFGRCAGCVRRAPPRLHCVFSRWYRFLVPFSARVTLDYVPFFPYSWRRWANRNHIYHLKSSFFCFPLFRIGCRSRNAEWKRSFLLCQCV